MTDQDPMLYGNDAERAAYREKVMAQVRQTIDEDRESHKAPTKETPATLIGGAGMPGGLNNAT